MVRDTKQTRGIGVVVLSAVALLGLTAVAWQLFPELPRQPSVTQVAAGSGAPADGGLAGQPVEDSAAAAGLESQPENPDGNAPATAEGSPGNAAGTPAPGETSASARVEAEGDAPATAVAEAASGKAARESEPEWAGPRERFAVLTHGGPVIVDLVIQLDGDSYDAALGRLVGEVFQAADADGDGTVTWKEMLENPRIRSGEFGNLVADTPEEQQQLVRLYDSDRDGQVDRAELPRFLTRNSGGGQAFSLRSSNEFRSTNRRRSPTRLLLDADVGGIRDGAITPEEMDAAPAALLNRDADDDGVVLLAELKSSLDLLQDLQQPAMSSRRRTNEPDTAVWLSNPAIEWNRRWGMVQFLMQELYSYGQAIRAADWPLTPQLFQLLDADSDGELKRAEFAQLLELPPHLVLSARFAAQPDGQQAGPRITLLSMAPELAQAQPLIRESPAQISLQFPTVKLDFFVNEDPTLSNIAQAAAAQFRGLDRDQNGYLEESEVPGQLPGTDATFAALDTDGDGRILEAELRDYLQQRSAVVRAQVRARVADQEDALFAVLDSNGDGGLNTREIREAPQVLRAIDRNGDGLLQSHEIPGSMVIGIVRGNSQQDAQLFAGPPAVVDPQRAAQPRWFRGMDSNADGEVSRREFFGDREQFERLDRNHDGYILPDELPPEESAPDPAPDPASGGF